MHFSRFKDAFKLNNASGILFSGGWHRASMALSCLPCPSPIMVFLDCFSPCLSDRWALMYLALCLSLSPANSRSHCCPYFTDDKTDDWRSRMITPGLSGVAELKCEFGFSNCDSSGIFPGVWRNWPHPKIQLLRPKDRLQIRTAACPQER